MKKKNKYVWMTLLLLLMLMPVQSIEANIFSSQYAGAERVAGDTKKEEEKKPQEATNNEEEKKHQKTIESEEGKKSQEATSEEEQKTQETENEKEGEKYQQTPEEENMDKVEDEPEAEEMPARIKVTYHEYAKSKSELYLKAGSAIQIVFSDDNFSKDHIQVMVHFLHYDEEKEKVEDISKKTLKDASWQDDDTKHTLSLTFNEEGHYQFFIHTDEEGEIYQSPLLTIDETNPVVEKFSSNLNPVLQKGEYDYYDSYPTYELIIAEENFDAKSFHLDSGKQNVKTSFWTSYYEEGIRKNKMTFTVEREGRYDISWEARDGSGIHKINGSCHFIIDHSAPKISISNDSAKGLLFYNYTAFHMFSKKTIPLCLWAVDEESGVDAITYAYWNKEGKIVEKTWKNDHFSNTFSKVANLDLDDFQGWISMKAINGRGLECEEIKSPSFLWESKETHEKLSHIKLNLEKAVYTDEKEKIKYYREKPDIFVEGADEYSGIAKSYVKATFGNDDDKEEKKYSDGKEITYHYKQKYDLSFQHMNTSNEKKAIRITAGFTDNAGHSSKYDSYDYGIVVDRKNPEISVSYDQNEENSYYKETRTATVTVEDLNLNINTIDWKIEGPKNGYEIGKWHREGNHYYCHVIFSKDGKYRLGLNVSDFSGNKASFKEKESFYMDKTVPQIRLWMNVQDVCHEKYYNKGKSVYILVKDEHMDMREINVYSGKKRYPVSLVMKENTIPGGSIGIMRQAGWSVYVVNLTKDGCYQLQASCVDQAGNLSGKVRMNPFIIDQKAPIIAFEHLKAQITYSDIVNPKILMEDSYLDAKDCTVEIYRRNGIKAGFLDKRIIRTSGKTNSVFHMEDFPRKQEYDNGYLLKVIAKDLAGNQKMSEIPFYVNRFGVRYDITEESKKYLKHYYHKKEKDLTVKAYSLHPLSTDVIMTVNDGEIIVLNSKDYEKESRKIKNKDGEFSKNKKILPSNMTGWYETTYRLPKELFSEEGNYEIAFSSVEQCVGDSHGFVKESENIMWTEPIQFAIDKTPPTVEIGGLDEKIYPCNRHKYTITAMDNYRLRRVRMHVRKDGMDFVKDYKEADFDELHRITSELTSSSNYQVIGYEAWDEAGNEANILNSSLEKKVLVTEEPMVQDIKKRSFGIFFAIVLAFAGLLFLTRHRFFAILKNSEKK
ncbi:MAG: hypothetical protein Q4E53_00950 [Eubacteriales bacterium]|nr:hypothetical protein [Eubacteriales bacterium]